MALKLWKDGVDSASIATIPENGNFKCIGNYYLAKRIHFYTMKINSFLKMVFVLTFMMA